MSATIIDGRAISAELRLELQRSATAFTEQTAQQPTLAVVWAGYDPASERYTRQIGRDFKRHGFAVQHYPLAEGTPESDLIDLLHVFERDERIHGVLVQTPLPDQISVERISLAIPVRKDVDAVNPVNAGFLFGGTGHYLAPATPAGGIELLERIGVRARGKHAVVVGRSPNVGKPMAIMLLHRDATVTICHSRTENLAEIVGQAEILIAAAGVPRLIPGSWLRKDVVVIDFGVNIINEQMVGDVEFNSALEIASAITPVPGGTGPMTVAMLMRNTLLTAQRLTPGASVHRLTT